MAMSARERKQRDYRDTGTQLFADSETDLDLGDGIVPLAGEQQVETGTEVVDRERREVARQLTLVPTDGECLGRVVHAIDAQQDEPLEEVRRVARRR